jgi:type I restriction enzyme, S subunit
MGELFANGRIGDIDMDLVPVNEAELNTMLVESGDLLFARQSLVLAGAGQCSIVTSSTNPTTFESHIIRARLDRAKANPDFYYYYFKSPACGIRSIVTQGVQAGIRGKSPRRRSRSRPSMPTVRSRSLCGDRGRCSRSRFRRCAKRNCVRR